MTTNRLIRTSTITLLALLALSTMAGAQVWTAVASSGTLRDSTSLNAFQASDATLFFRFGATGNIGATYNVTNPKDNSSNPAWTTLEFTASNSGGLSATATATLYRVSRGFSSAVILCSAVAPATGALTTSTCTFSSSLIDFTNNYYYVLVSLGRDNTNQNQTAVSLRIF